jgi:hypothetical protein
VRWRASASARAAVYQARGMTTLGCFGSLVRKGPAGRLTAPTGRSRSLGLAAGWPAPYQTTGSSSIVTP